MVLELILTLIDFFFSVANTVKRALLIWISVIIFKNTITFYSGLGTMIVSEFFICVLLPSLITSLFISGVFGSFDV